MFAKNSSSFLGERNLASLGLILTRASSCNRRGNATRFAGSARTVCTGGVHHRQLLSRPQRAAAALLSPVITRLEDKTISYHDICKKQNLNLGETRSASVNFGFHLSRGNHEFFCNKSSLYINPGYYLSPLLSAKSVQ